MDRRFARLTGIAGISVVFLFTGCMQVAEPATGTNASFRDLPAYFAQEQHQLKQAGLVFHKVAEQNGWKDSLTTSDTAAIAYLLKPFMGIDLNKPSLRDQYMVDSVVNDFNGARSLSYTAKTPAVNPQQVLLETDSAGNIQSVQMNARTSNLLYKTSSTLVYQHLKTVSVTTDQQVVLLAPTHLSVQVRMYPK